MPQGWLHGLRLCRRGQASAYPPPPHRAPLNEDVFTPPAPSPALSLDSDIQELSEQIHRLLLQVNVEGWGLEMR